MEDNARQIPVILAMSIIALIVVMCIILLFIKIWISRPIKKATSQVDELVDSIKETEAI